MAHSSQKRHYSRGIFRRVLFLVGVVMVVYTVGPPLRGYYASCPCVCACSSELAFSLDCGKHDPELREEMEKDTVTLLSEELALQKTVASEILQHSTESIINARKSSSLYQREAEKCNAGIETCEEAREKAENELREESRVSALWERRAREQGWKDDSRTNA